MSRIAEQGVVGIVRADDADAAMRRARLLLDAGLRVVEVALTTPRALTVIETLRHEYGDSVTVGAGTVLDPPTANAAILAGARLLVTPTLSLEVIRTANRYGVPVLTGCASPTEMLTALEAGAAAIKIFPASAWSPTELRAVREPLPHLPCVPTGGIGHDTAAAWIEAGAVAVGMGGGLAAGTADEIRSRVEDLLTAVRGARRTPAAVGA